MNIILKSKFMFFILFYFSMDKIFCPFGICWIFFKNKSNNNIQKKGSHRCFNEDTALGITFCAREPDENICNKDFLHGKLVIYSNFCKNFF